MMKDIEKKALQREVEELESQSRSLRKQPMDIKKGDV